MVAALLHLSGDRSEGDLLHPHIGALLDVDAVLVHGAEGAHVKLDHVAAISALFGLIPPWDTRSDLKVRAHIKLTLADRKLERRLSQPACGTNGGRSLEDQL